jgi:hypothetical protein
VVGDLLGWVFVFQVLCCCCCSCWGACLFSKFLVVVVLVGVCFLSSLLLWVFVF